MLNSSVFNQLRAFSCHCLPFLGETMLLPRERHRCQCGQGGSKPACHLCTVSRAREEPDFPTGYWRQKSSYVSPTPLTGQGCGACCGSLFTSSTHLSTRLPIHPSTYLPNHPSIHSSIHPSTYPPMHSFTHAFILPPTQLSICPVIHLLIYPCRWVGTIYLLLLSKNPPVPRVQAFTHGDVITKYHTEVHFAAYACQLYFFH